MSRLPISPVDAQSPDARLIARINDLESRLAISERAGFEEAALRLGGTNQTCTANAHTALHWDNASVTFQRGLTIPDLLSQTPRYRFYAPVPGLYAFGCHIESDPGTGTVRGLVALKNGGSGSFSNVVAEDRRYGGAANYQPLLVNGVIHMTAADWIEFTYHNDSAANIMVYKNGPRFGAWIYRVG
jgi:hypothetical protein